MQSEIKKALPGSFATLVALVEDGPLWDGDLPSKTESTALIDAGYAIRVLVDGRDGYTASTIKGSTLYRLVYGSSDTVPEAKAYRKMLAVICSAQAVT